MATKRNGRTRGGVAAWALALAGAVALCAALAWASDAQAAPGSTGEYAPNVPNTAPGDVCTQAQNAWAELTNLQSQLDNWPTKRDELTLAVKNAETAKSQAGVSLSDAKSYRDAKKMALDLLIEKEYGQAAADSEQGIQYERALNSYNNAVAAYQTASQSYNNAASVLQGVQDELTKGEKLPTQIATAQVNAETLQAKCDAQTASPDNSGAYDEVIRTLGYPAVLHAKVTLTGAAAAEDLTGMMVFQLSENSSSNSESGGGGGQR